MGFGGGGIGSSKQLGQRVGRLFIIFYFDPLPRWLPGFGWHFRRITADGDWAGNRGTGQWDWDRDAHDASYYDLGFPKLSKQFQKSGSRYVRKLKEKNNNASFYLSN